MNIRKDVIAKSISIPPDGAANASARVSVYPNPVADKATVQIIGQANDVAHITLIDVKGETHFSTKQVLPESGQFNGEINLQDLRAGLYYMHVRFKGDSFSERVLISD